MELSGILTALWTPTDETGRIMTEAMEAHLGFLRGTRLRGVMVLGSTGESVLLDPARRRIVLETTARAAGSLLRIAHVGDVNPTAACELAAAARDLGYQAVSILPPWFFHLEREDLLAHFTRIARAAKLPVVLYNFPERTGHRLDEALIERFADEARLVAIKQSGAEFEYHHKLAELGRRKGFVVFTGADPRLAEAMAAGAVGNIGGLSNFVPEWMTELYDAVRNGNQAQSRAVTARLEALDALFGKVRFPWNMGIGVAARGFQAGSPKQVLSESSRRGADELLGALRDVFREWGLARPS